MTKIQPSPTDDFVDRASKERKGNVDANSSSNDAARKPFEGTRILPWHGKGGPGFNGA